MNESKSEYGRYLRLLGVALNDPTPELLRRLVRAHLEKIPFENTSKLSYWRTFGFNALMDLTQFLDGIEVHHFGGTCYPTGYHLNGLLSHLGFEVCLSEADMARPSVRRMSFGPSLSTGSKSDSAKWGM